MKDLKITDDTTLRITDLNSIVAIRTSDKGKIVDRKYVSFNKLSEWVSSINEQIITVATDTKPCSQCETWKNGYFACYCPVCGRALSR